ncbi:MAG: repeat protein [Phycisphaerales bacterium]|jgi:HEAT repeat protein|nr:repeat protein [Phycisphaerales bacterium]
MLKRLAKFAEMERDIDSEARETRGRAMHDLLILAERDPAIRPAASEIFRRAVATPKDAWSTNTALHGIALLHGAQAARDARIRLLSHPDPAFVASIVRATRDAIYVPALLKLLSERAETPIRVAAIRALGRLRDPAALAVLVAQLHIPDLRPHTIEALADLSDPRAVPYLEPFRADTTDAWEEDNHGPMLCVCDLVDSAVKRLSKCEPCRS